MRVYCIHKNEFVHTLIVVIYFLQHHRYKYTRESCGQTVKQNFEVFSFASLLYRIHFNLTYFDRYFRCVFRITYEQLAYVLKVLPKQFAAWSHIIEKQYIRVPLRF